MEDTIVAISTALGVGAISIVRISGPNAIKFVNKIWKGPDLEQAPTHTIHYGHIVDSDLIVDEVLVMLMRAPKTYTGEDTIEINCHGGIATTNKIVELSLQAGCRFAEPGEFTKWRFLNGRIDLTQADGVMDLIEAKTEEARKMAMNTAKGNVSKLIRCLRQQIIEVLANIEVNIDYSEYEDIEELTLAKITPLLDQMETDMDHILNESKNGQLIKEGIKTCIIGRPNVGKSSLLNALLGEEKAIVTSIAGTTRDIVEGTINLNGMLLHMIDTAGIRETNDLVEKIGVEKSLNLAKEADLVLFVLNYNTPMNDEERQILQQIKDKNHLIILNKVDLDQKIDMELLKEEVVIPMSVTQGQGIDQLKHKIKTLFDLDRINTGDFTYLTNARGLNLLKKAKISLNEVRKGIQSNMPIDMIELDLKEIWNILGEMIGESYEEELIDQLFSQFCLGK